MNGLSQRNRAGRYVGAMSTAILGVIVEVGVARIIRFAIIAQSGREFILRPTRIPIGELGFPDIRVSAGQTDERAARMVTGRFRIYRMSDDFEFIHPTPESGKSVKRAIRIFAHRHFARGQLEQGRVKIAPVIVNDAIEIKVHLRS